MSKIKHCTSDQQFAELVCSEVFKNYSEIIRVGASFNLVLSGGRTPTLIYRYLVDNYIEKIDWARVVFYFVDERCVVPASLESNYGTAKRHLFDYLGPVKVHRLKGEIDPVSAALEYEEIISDVVLHCAILGMGEDGHVGSIFPESKELCDSGDVISTKKLYKQYRRLSLTLKAINRIENKILIINKSCVKLNILESKDLRYPINRLSDLYVLSNTDSSKEDC